MRKGDHVFAEAEIIGIDGENELAFAGGSSRRA